MKRTLGTCYYPEHWPEEIWADDAARMVEIGLTWVRIGEFAWSRLEPTPGKMTFEWLDRAVDVLGAAGLKIVLGTPTATPPRWMIDKHPDMLAVDLDGRPRGFGSRRHYCFSHDGYRDESARITRLFAERYGKNPHVAAWQTDNEYGCHDTTVSYSDAAHKAFQVWCQNRYGNIEALNEAWGNIFWSMDYQSFDQIGLPNLTVTEANPAHCLAFRRFSSDQVVRFNQVQVDIIRAHSDAPISHNYMGRITDFDHWKTGDQMEIATWDSYPLGFLEDRVGADDAHQSANARQGDPDFQAFHHDLYRAVGKGRWWVMEQQPGPVNWAPYNPAPMAGMERLWAWEAFAHGAECVAYFRWRQAPFAQEQMHAGMLRPDSEPATAYYAAKQVARELAELPEVAVAQAPIALVFDYDAQWSWEVQPQGQGLDYFQLVFDMYKALRRLGQSVDILRPDVSDLSGYKLILVPGVQTLTDQLKAAISKAEASILLGPRTNSKTSELSIPVPLPPQIDGLDVTISRVESLRPDMPIPIEGGGVVTLWREFLEGNADVQLRTQDGEPLLVGSDTLRYLGGYLDPVAMQGLLEILLQDQGLEVAHMPDGLRCRRAGDMMFVINYGTDPQDYQGQTIAPAGVYWYKSTA